MQNLLAVKRLVEILLVSYDESFGSSFADPGVAETTGTRVNREQYRAENSIKRQRSAN